MDPDDPYHLAWERINTLLSRCPQHGLPDWVIVDKFYNGLTFEKQQIFNTATGGHIMDKLEPAECEEMFESFALAEQQQPRYTRTSIPSARASTSSPRGVHQVNPDSSVVVALAAMANEIKELKLSALRCEVCRGGHDTRECPISQQEHGRSAKNRCSRHFMEESAISIPGSATSVGDIAQSLQDRLGGPSSGPNASVMAVSIGSHREEEEVSHNAEYRIPSPAEVEEEIAEENPAEKVEEKEKGVEMKSPEIDLSRIPYPARLLPHKHAREYGHFLNIFKQRKVNFPFVEDLQHMPKYGKFLKDLLSKMKKLEEVSKVSLSEQSSVVV
ncbi:hypothetical protein L1987_33139 [Smallanthus sonchifolius]|uniref:Uncharacterized protein n=1 Tax=Smallanthus sonchifolius TaxID=185202 RepID=A0ACB9HRK0_9ASTR|nr:hypothetical protein L1987_33139 [Smallanthus sonchifolius]